MLYIKQLNLDNQDCGVSNAAVKFGNLFGKVGNGRKNRFLLKGIKESFKHPEYKWMRTLGMANARSGHQCSIYPQLNSSGMSVVEREYVYNIDNGDSFTWRDLSPFDMWVMALTHSQLKTDEKYIDVEYKRLKKGGVFSRQFKDALIPSEGLYQDGGQDRRNNSSFVFDFPNCKPFIMTSTKYLRDEFDGIPEDCDNRAIRYKNPEGRIYKMKIGKFLNQVHTEMVERGEALPLPEMIKNAAIEEITAKWMARVEEANPVSYELKIDDSYEGMEKIYNSSMHAGEISSCMNDDGYTDAYIRDNWGCRAAWLEKGEKIYCRCVIFDNVRDLDGNHYRLAERQYAIKQDHKLEELLVSKLIAANEIDGYKKPGSSCHEPKGFWLNNGDKLNKYLYFKAQEPDAGEYYPYMDSFKWYNYKEGCYQNEEPDGFKATFENTDGSYDQTDRNHSSRYDEYITDDRAHWSEWEEDYVSDYDGDRSYGIYCDDICDWAYEDHCCYCEIKDIYVSDENAVYSDLLGDWVDKRDLDELEDDYKCNNWTYDEYKQDYYDAELDTTVIYIDDRGHKYETREASLDEDGLLDICKLFDEVNGYDYEVYVNVDYVDEFMAVNGLIDDEEEKAEAVTEATAV